MVEAFFSPASWGCDVFAPLMDVDKLLDDTALFVSSMSHTAAPSHYSTSSTSSHFPSFTIPSSAPASSSGVSFSAASSSFIPSVTATFTSAMSAAASLQPVASSSSSVLCGGGLGLGLGGCGGLGALGGGSSSSSSSGLAPRLSSFLSVPSAIPTSPAASSLMQPIFPTPSAAMFSTPSSLSSSLSSSSILSTPSTSSSIPIPTFAHDAHKYLEQNAHTFFPVSCEDIEALMAWEQLLRPTASSSLSSSASSTGSIPAVPSISAVASSVNSPCATSDAETVKRCSPVTPSTKRARPSRKRAESRVTVSPGPESPVPRRREQQQQQRRTPTKAPYVPVVPKSKRARALEMMMKRDNHNDSERQRRGEMKDGLQQLRSVLPASDDIARMNTGQLLEHAIEYIKQVVEEEERLVAEKAALQHENTRLLSLVM